MHNKVKLSFQLILANQRRNRDLNSFFIHKNVTVSQKMFEICTSYLRKRKTLLAFQSLMNAKSSVQILQWMFSNKQVKSISSQLKVLSYLSCKRSLECSTSWCSMGYLPSNRSKRLVDSNNEVEIPENLVISHWCVEYWRYSHVELQNDV